MAVPLLNCLELKWSSLDLASTKLRKNHFSQFKSFPRTNTISRQKHLALQLQHLHSLGIKHGGFCGFFNKEPFFYLPETYMLGGYFDYVPKKSYLRVTNIRQSRPAQILLTNCVSCLNSGDINLIARIPIDFSIRLTNRFGGSIGICIGKPQ